MTGSRPRPPQGRCRTVTEFTVAGPFGPVLRAAFDDQHVAIDGPCTVIRTGPGTDLDVTDLVRTMIERGLQVQRVCRLVDLPEHRGSSALAPDR